MGALTKAVVKVAAFVGVTVYIFVMFFSFVLV